MKQGMPFNGKKTGWISATLAVFLFCSLFEILCIFPGQNFSQFQFSVRDFSNESQGSETS